MDIISNIRCHLLPDVRVQLTRSLNKLYGQHGFLFYLWFNIMPHQLILYCRQKDDNIHVYVLKCRYVNPDTVPIISTADNPLVPITDYGAFGLFFDILQANDYKYINGLGSADAGARWTVWQQSTYTKLCLHTLPAQAPVNASVHARYILLNIFFQINMTLIGEIGIGGIILQYMVLEPPTVQSTTTGVVYFHYSLPITDSIKNLVHDPAVRAFMSKYNDRV